jgi:uncharacterized membrane protein
MADSVEAALTDSAPKADVLVPAPYYGAPPRLARAEWVATLMAVGLLAAEGAAMGLFVAMLTTRLLLSSFMGENAASPQLRNQLLVGVAGGIVVSLVVAAIVAWRTRPRAALSLERAALRGLPCLLAPALPALFIYNFAFTHQLSYLMILSIVGLGGEQIMRRFLPALPPALVARVNRLPGRLSAPVRARLPLALVIVAACAYALVCSYFALITHHRLATSGYDLGIFDNLMWNALHGHPFRSTVMFGPKGGNSLATHAEFAMLLFLPIYALHQGPETLLVLQAVLLGGAAIPLFLFARTRVSASAAAAVAIGYLLFAPLHGAQFYDFHWLPIATFFYFILFYALARQRTRLAIAMVVVLFMVREEMAVGLAILGMFLFVTEARPRFGLLLTVAAVLWFAMDKFVIMPSAGPWWFADMYRDLIAPGERGYGSVIKTVLVDPVYFLSTLWREGKLILLLHLFAPLVFLPLRRPALVLLSMPGFFFTLMTTGYTPTLTISFQYTTHWIPFIFAAAAISLGLFAADVPGRLRRHSAIAAWALVLLSHSVIFGVFFQPNFYVGFGYQRYRMTPEEKRRYADLNELVALIPKDASVAATETECPHVSSRKNAYTLKDMSGDADYLLINRMGVAAGPRNNIIDAMRRHPYELVATRKTGLYLFRQGKRTLATESAMRELGLPL